MAGTPRVLIVEDDSAIRTLLTAALKREPVEVHTANDGLAALEHVRAHDYAVILLDLMMPRLDGFEFLESLPQVRPEAAPVIIVMTAFDATAVKRLGGLRVQAILHKPFDIERVVEMVRDCAMLYRHQAGGQQEGVDAPTPLARPADSEDMVC